MAVQENVQMLYGAYWPCVVGMYRMAGKMSTESWSKNSGKLTYQRHLR